MADLFPRLYDITKAKRPDAWVYSEIQWDNLLDHEAMDPLRGLPGGAIYQHTVNNTYWNGVKSETMPAYAATIPTRTNVFRSQGTCQWNGDQRTERYFFNGRDFAEMARKANVVESNGLTVWGEASSSHTNAELSYLAFARFTCKDVALLLGGVDAANR